GSGTTPAAVTPATATSELSSHGRQLQNTVYPMTNTPYETQLSSVPDGFSLPTNPETLPTATEGALLAPARRADSIANYPTTQYPEVRLAAVDTVSSSPPADDCQSQLTATIRAMESNIAASANKSPSAAEQAMLRMLYLAAGRRDDALQPMT